MRDFLPADVRKREYVIKIIKEVYESYGFEPLETPAVENLETLTGKYGEEGNQLMFKILKRGEKLELATAKSEKDLADLALRYDLTVPLARVVANNRNELPKFFKRYQIQPVWRADRPARGRFREFYQCDVDAIGSRSMAVEAELIAAVSDILTRLGFQDFVVRINHREVLRAMLDAAGIQPEKHADALVALDKLDKIGPEGVSREFAERGIDGADSLLTLFAEIANADNELVVEKLRAFFGSHESGGTAVAEIEQILNLLASANIRVDASLARGLSYYTGTIMEINVTDLAGSLGGGGRYDGLIGMFGKEQIPACGFSLGLERILVVMDERGMFPTEIAESAPADVLVTVFSEETLGDSLRFAAGLRDQGVRVTLYPEADKIGKQLKYADAIGVRYVCILGPEEIASGKAKFKDLQTGEETSQTSAELGGILAKRPKT